MKFTKKGIYIGLFGVLYLIVAFSSFFHACAFFGLANNSWMSIILAFAFEVGQAAVLFSLLTSVKDRGRVMPWVLMTMFTLVQVIGNVYSSYKYIVTNSVDNLRYFKEPIFIWTSLPDDQATVIVVYLVGALLPIAALLLTSMITNYLSDQEEIKNKEIEQIEQIKQEEQKEIDGPVEGEGRSDEQEIKDLNTLVDNKEQEIENLKKELEEKNKQLENVQQSQQTIEEDPQENIETTQNEDETPNGDTQQEDNKEIIYDSVDEALAHEHDGEGVPEFEQVKSWKEIQEEKKQEEKKPSHFINL